LSINALTIRPETSNTIKLTVAFAEILKAMVVLGLNGFGAVFPTGIQGEWACLESAPVFG